jgi:predicted Zn-dependent peptidase
MDNQGTLGLAHYVEHLAWHSAFGEAPVDTIQANAYTTLDHIAYFVQAQPSDLTQSLQRLAKVTEPLRLSEEFAVQEAKIVAREYEFAVSENPYHDISEQFYTRHYANDMRARSIIGTPQSIAAFTLEEAKAWHQATHLRGAATVVIVGPHSKSEAQAALSTVLDVPNLAPAPLPPRAPIDLSARQGGIGYITSDKLSQPQLFAGRLATIQKDISAPEAQAQIDLLYHLLDSTLEGGLAGPLRFQARIAQSYDFSLYLVTPSQASMVFGAARPDAGITPEALNTAIDETLAAIVAKGIAQDSFDRIQARLLRDVGNDDPAATTAGFISDAIGQRRAPFDAAHYSAALQEARVDDVMLWLRALAQSPAVVDIITPTTNSPAQE